MLLKEDGIFTKVSTSDAHFAVMLAVVCTVKYYVCIVYVVCVLTLIINTADYSVHDVRCIG